MVLTSHISPFEAFPYISIDLEHVKVHETKDKINTPIVDVEEIFLGFDIWTILSGNMEIKEIILKIRQSFDFISIKSDSILVY